MPGVIIATKAVVKRRGLTIGLAPILVWKDKKMRQFNAAVIGAQTLSDRNSSNCLMNVISRRIPSVFCLRPRSGRQETFFQTSGNYRSGTVTAILPRCRYRLFLVGTGSQPLFCAAGSPKQDAGHRYQQLFPQRQRYPDGRAEVNIEDTKLHRGIISTRTAPRFNWR